MIRPLLIGEDNPYGSAEEFALYPRPDGCSGHRLMKIIGVDEETYLDDDRFHRVNLCDGPWTMKAARTRVTILMQRAEYQVYVLLGRKVAQAFGRAEPAFSVVDERVLRAGDVSTVKLVLLPHPSGRNLIWNEPGRRELARSLLAQVGVL